MLGLMLEPKYQVEVVCCLVFFFLESENLIEKVFFVFLFLNFQLNSTDLVYSLENHETSTIQFRQTKDLRDDI